MIFENGLAPDGVVSSLRTVLNPGWITRRTGHTSALLLISFLNERANQRNGNESIIPIFRWIINLHRLFFSSRRVVFSF